MIRERAKEKPAGTAGKREKGGKKKQSDKEGERVIGSHVGYIQVSYL